MKNKSNLLLQKYFCYRYIILIVCYYLCTTLCISCNENNIKNIDLSKVKINFIKTEYYKELFKLDTIQIERSIDSLAYKYPAFSSVFFNELTGFANTNNKDFFLKAINHFITYKDYRLLYDSVKSKFSDTKKIDNDLISLFKHIKYYFPNEKWGHVYYFISGLNQWSAITVDTLLGIGLDMHLGKKFPYYASVQIPDYQIQNCEPEYIQINAAKTIFKNNKPENATGKNLLDLMIYKGFEMTFTEYCLPHISDEKLMGYTKSQIDWCKKNERMIWSYFKKQNLIFATEWQQILRYINEGPTSTGMPPESPGNIGTWIGWQIIRKYLSENPDIKWNEIIYKNIDSESFLRQSKYKP